MEENIILPIVPTTPEGKVVNEIAAYLNKHGKFNAIKIADMVYKAMQEGGGEMRSVEREIMKQCIENMRTHALWEKWGD